MVKAKRDNSASTKRYLHHFFSIFIILLSNHFFPVSWPSKIRSVRYKTKRPNEVLLLSYPLYIFLFYFDLLILIYFEFRHRLSRCVFYTNLIQQDQRRTTVTTSQLSSLLGDAAVTSSCRRCFSFSYRRPAD